jgi:hypothetical protein
MKINRDAAVLLFREYEKLGIPEEFKRVVKVAGAEKFGQLSEEMQVEVFLFLIDFLYGLKQTHNNQRQ